MWLLSKYILYLPFREQQQGERLDMINKEIFFNPWFVESAHGKPEIKKAGYKLMFESF